MESVHALILAAGEGRRLRPLTDTTPKCLAPILGRPLLDYWLFHLTEAGVRRAVVNYHAHAEQMEAYLQKARARGGLELFGAHEPELLGSAGTVAAQADFLSAADLALVIYGDNLSDLDLRGLVDHHVGHQEPITLALFRPPDLRDCGVAVLDDSGTVTDFEEKPDRPRGDAANAGVCVLDREAVEEIRGIAGFDLARDVLPRFLGRMKGFVWDGDHLDIGTPERYHDARALAPRLLASRGYAADGLRPAVFLDRDGTLIEHVHYLSRTDQVRLAPGAAESIRRLRSAGFAVVVVTNQSAVGRGILDEVELAAIHARMCEDLAQEGAALDAIYYDTTVPSSRDRTAVEHPDRKPGPGMLLRAATELGLELRSSWMIGDMVSDLLAGENAGCRGSIGLAGSTLADGDGAERFPKVHGLGEAVDWILARRAETT